MRKCRSAGTAAAMPRFGGGWHWQRQFSAFAGTWPIALKMPCGPPCGKLPSTNAAALWCSA